MSKSKAIGTACETGLVRYLHANGFPTAERRALKGSNDVGDVLASAGLIFEVKGGKAAGSASDAQIAAWMDECDVERRNSGADLCPLVTKRAGYNERSIESVGSWWMHLRMRDLISVASDTPFFAPLHANTLSERSRPGFPVRFTVRQGVALLRWAGWGDRPA